MPTKLLKFLFITTLPIIFCSYDSKTDQAFYINGETQGTTYNITYWAPDSLIAKEEIEGLLAQLDSSLSIYKSYSLITKFNNDLEGIMVDHHLETVVKKSLEVNRETQGKFDITVYPLVNAWGFGNEKHTALPDKQTINELLKCVGSEKIMLLQNYLKKASPCVKIDVNGIAQGYSVDVVANYLTQRGINNFLVEIGGEVIAKGLKPNGEGMNIGIEGPSATSQEEAVISKIITIKNAAVTTSGNYRKYIEKGKERISHLIDPKTGYTIVSPMVSVTVIAKDAMTADGYDNPLMAMQPEEALAFARSHQIEMYCIYHQSNGKLADTATAGFYKLLVSKNKY